jgi:hypothetical protein
MTAGMRCKEPGCLLISLLVATFTAGCPTRTVDYPDGGEGGHGVSGEDGGAGRSPGGLAGSPSNGAGGPGGAAGGLGGAAVGTSGSGGAKGGAAGGGLAGTAGPSSGGSGGYGPGVGGTSGGSGFGGAGGQMGCGPGSVLLGGSCKLVEAPRQIAPLSTAIASSRRPRFHWELADGSTGARLQICRDRACGSPIVTVDGVGTSAVPAGDLPSGVLFWRLFGMNGSTIGVDPSPSWEIRIGVRTAPVDASWGTFVDVNGDGYADLAISSSVVLDSGAPPSTTGYVRIYLGGPSGISTTPIMALTDPNGASNFGSSVASAGDVNGDGYSDVIISASSISNNAGRAYVFLGSSNGLPPTPTSTILAPDGQGGLFGSSVASAGDVNGDGYADVIVGAQSANSGIGTAHLFLGAATGISTTPAVSLTTTLVGTDTSGYFGHSVAGAGDVNGDGFGDVVVGAYRVGGNGRAYVYLGSPSGIEAIPAATLLDPGGGSSFGYTVAGAEDVNGDGYADVIIGGAASVFIYPGTARGVSGNPLSSLTGAGAVVAAVGDVNGDGFADVVGCDSGASNGTGIIGAPNVGSGSAYLYLGSATSFPLDPTTTLVGPVTDSNFGVRLD